MLQFFVLCLCSKQINIIPMYACLKFDGVAGWVKKTVVLYLKGFRFSSTTYYRFSSFFSRKLHTFACGMHITCGGTGCSRELAISRDGSAEGAEGAEGVSLARLPYRYEQVLPKFVNCNTCSLSVAI